MDATSFAVQVLQTSLEETTSIEQVVQHIFVNGQGCIQHNAIAVYRSGHWIGDPMYYEIGLRQIISVIDKMWSYLPR